MNYKYEQVKLCRPDDDTPLFLTCFSGPDSRPDRHILLVHGLTYTQYVFDLRYKDYSLCAFLADNGYHVWRLDLSGYGESGRYEDGFRVNTRHAAEDQIFALEKIRQVAGADAADLLGWSWGCMTTAQVSALRPDLVRKLIWLGPCLGGVFPPTPVTEPFTYMDYRYVVRVFQHLPGTTGQETDPDTLEPVLLAMWLDEIFRRDDGRGWPNGGAKEIMEAGDHWLIDVSAVQNPTLLVSGDQDFYVNLDRCRQAEKKLPGGSRFLFLPGAGHAMYLEKHYYRTTREAILTFLNS